MSEKNDGGPAFPHLQSEWDESEHRYDIAQHVSGMSMRDYFAAAALQGMLGGAPGSHLVPNNAVREAYEYADAMLKERER